MSTRISIVTLLSAVLLGCPFICLGEAVGTSCGEFACCDCQDQEPAPGACPMPDGPVEDEPDCLCRGAIAGADGPSIVSDLENEVRFIEDIDVLLAGAHSVVNRFVESLPFRASHFPPLSSGRDICALISARLL